MPTLKSSTKSRSQAAIQSTLNADGTPIAVKSSDAVTLPVVPLRGMVAYPNMVLPLFIGRDRSVAAIAAAGEADKQVLLLSQTNEEIEEPGVDDLFRFGTVGEIVQMMKMPDGNVRVVIEGRRRAKVLSLSQDAPYFAARVQAFDEREVKLTPELEAIARRLKSGFEQVVAMSKSVPPEAAQNAQGQDDLAALADLVVSFLEVSVEERQKVLEMLSPAERARYVAGLLAHELQILEIDRELDSQVREGVNDSQREYFLRERMKAIQEKLGSGGDSSFKEADQLRQKVESAQMSSEARDKALAEIERLEKMPPIAPEVSVIRTYVELMCDLPWHKRSDDHFDLRAAQSTLDEDHYALEKIKDRILEFLAVRKLNPNSKGPILCFMGPPGVGKTSIGKSIAKALGREFIRVSMGGVHDEAEIRGHRRTYIGSMPGRLISAMRRVKVKNPVFLLDEIDKLGRDYRGDPSSALLEALDPEQNNAFSDHYLEVPFDLSQVMWIATGNLLDPIPPALRDRLEVIRFPGYTEREKFAIARRFLLPKQMKENGIDETHLELNDDGLTTLIRDYTREAGVRNLEREIGTVCRKIARQVAEREPGDGDTDQSTLQKPKRPKTKTRSPKPDPRPPAQIGSADLQPLLGARKFVRSVAQEKDEIGVAQGLAWTEVGGEIMPIEVSLVGGKGQVKLTGNLGNVMKESCEAAMTFARSHATELGIDGDWTLTHDAHIHVPAGAVPKDGPSAGVAIAIALVSSMTNRPVRKEVAVTGEISLRGKVLSVGGIKEKILAAHRAGATKVLLPRENERDLDDIPTEVRDELQFHLIDLLGDALEIALHPRSNPDAIGATPDAEIVKPTAAKSTRQSTLNGKASVPKKRITKAQSK